MLKKIFLTVCIAAIALMTGVFASGEVVDYYIQDIEKGDIVIYGALPQGDVNNYVTISVLNPGYTRETADNFAADTAINSFKKTALDENGEFSVKIRLRNAQTGTYTAVIRSGGMSDSTECPINFYIGEGLTEILENIRDEIKEGDEEGLSEYLNEDILRIIGVRNTYLNNITLSDICKLVENSPSSDVTADIDKIKRTLEGKAVIKMLSEGSAGDLIKKAATDEQALDILSMGDTEKAVFRVLKKCGADALNGIVEAVNQKAYDDMEKFIEALSISVLDEAIGNADTYIVVRDVLKDYEEEFTTSYSSEYNSLSSTEKASAENKLKAYAVANTVKSADEIAKEFLSIIKDEKGTAAGGSISAGKGSGSGSGGGGGGGGSSVMGSVASTIVKDANAVEAKIGKIPFTDIDGVEWAHESIIALEKSGVISGRDNMKFEPDAAVTREEFVKMVVLALEVEVDEALAISFADVLNTDWYYSYVETAYSAGIVTGVNDLFFGAGLNISREEMAAILYRTAKKAGLNSGNTQMTFNDKASISDYAVEAVGALSGMGIINGKGNGVFEPKASATRAEAAKVVYMMSKALSK